MSRCNIAGGHLRGKGKGERGKGKGEKYRVTPPEFLVYDIVVNLFTNDSPPP